MEKTRSAFWKLPGTMLGKWSVGFLLFFSVLYIVNMLLFGLRDATPGEWREAILPIFSLVMLVSGVLSGIMGLVAILRDRERSWTAWLSILPLAFILFLLAGEFLIPH